MGKGENKEVKTRAKGGNFESSFTLLLLTDRAHNVSVNDISSKPQQADCVCGIAQGLILGPVLLILCINDLPNVVSGRT